MSKEHTKHNWNRLKQRTHTDLINVIRRNVRSTRFGKSSAEQTRLRTDRSEKAPEVFVRDRIEPNSTDIADRLEPEGAERWIAMRS